MQPQRVDTEENVEMTQSVTDNTDWEQQSCFDRFTSALAFELSHQHHDEQPACQTHKLISHLFMALAPELIY